MLTPEQCERLDSLTAYDWWKEGEDCQAGLRKLVVAIDSPEELWFAVIAKPWDMAENELEPILNHPLCERGVALMIYWASAPDRYYWRLETGCAMDEHEMKWWSAIKQLEEKLLTGFSGERIAFDPIEFLQRSCTSLDEYHPGIRLVPDPLKRATNGTKLTMAHHSSLAG